MQKEKKAVRDRARKEDARAEELGLERPKKIPRVRFVLRPLTVFTSSDTLILEISIVLYFTALSILFISGMMTDLTLRARILTKFYLHSHS